MQAGKRLPLISWTESGLACEAGGFHIDPNRKVATAVITHAHSDHARRGSQRYLCHRHSIGLLKQRLGPTIQIEGMDYGERRQLGQVTISLHPAGHILGSAQVRVEAPSGEIWVASGDYKRDRDPTCAPFESVSCDVFITEATFGLPMYRWGNTERLGLDIHEWWMRNASENRNSVLLCYSLGKAQRILAELAEYTDRRVFVHPTITPLNDCYREAGVRLLPTAELKDLEPGKRLEGELLLVPPGAQSSTFVEQLGVFATAFASGWTRGGSHRLREGTDASFVMSDHADWPSLLRTIEETGARQVFVGVGREPGSGRDGVLVRYLRDRGIQAGPVEWLAGEIDGLREHGPRVRLVESENSIPGLRKRSGTQPGRDLGQAARQEEFPFS